MTHKLTLNDEKRDGIIEALKQLRPRRTTTEINKQLGLDDHEWIPATVDPSWRVLTDRGVSQSINMFIEAHMG